MTHSSICIITALMIAGISASKVLMVLPLGPPSHKNIFTPIAQKLGEKGHDVTVVSMYSSKYKGSTTPAYKELVAENAHQRMVDYKGEFNVFQMNEKRENIDYQMFTKVVANIHVYCDAFLRDPAVQSAWVDKPDLIMLPAFMNECGLVLIQKFKTPFILVTTSGLPPWTADIMGNPVCPEFVPLEYLPYTDDMNLWQRAINSIFRIISPCLRQRYVFSRLENVTKAFLKEDNFSLIDLERNASLVLVNSHHSLGSLRPMLPNVIEIGGIQCRPSKDMRTIDLELHHFLDASGDRNAILFSLGSHINSSSMTDGVLSMFVNVFNRLPYNVVWKWEGKRPANLSSNVITRPWLPQQDVLGHPAIGAFFTHGGLLSLQEAVYHGVPIVVLPFMSDQRHNANQAKFFGMATVLQLGNLSEQNIEDAILQVMNNPSYGNEARRRSVIMKDQETHPLDRAVYWTEYVMRHQGAAHLKSKAANLSIIQYFQIDVGLVLLFGALFISSLVVYIIYFLFKLFLVLSLWFVERRAVLFFPGLMIAS